MAGTKIRAIDKHNIKIRWKEEYVSSGLNKKLCGLVPTGIIRGGLLCPSPSGQKKVIVKADEKTNDIVVSYEDTNGNQMTVNLGKGDIELDLSNFNFLPQEYVYIGLYVDYKIGHETVAEWRYYSYPTEEAIIFGSYCPNVNIVSLKRRDDAWKNISSGMIRWIPFIKNGGFEQRLAHWRYFTEPQWDYLFPDRAITQFDNKIKNEGSVSLRLNYLHRAKFWQGFFECEPGQLILVKLAYKTENLAFITTGYAGNILINYYNTVTGEKVTHTVSGFISDSESTTIDWTDHEIVIENKPEYNANSIEIVISFGNLSDSNTGTIWLDSIRGFFQVKDTIKKHNESDNVGLVSTNCLELFDHVEPLTTELDPKDLSREKGYLYYENPARTKYLGNLRMGVGVGLGIESYKTSDGVSHPTHFVESYGNLHLDKLYLRLDNTMGTGHAPFIPGTVLSWMLPKAIGIFEVVGTSIPSPDVVIRWSKGVNKIKYHEVFSGDSLRGYLYDIYLEDWIDSSFYDVIVCNVTSRYWTVNSTINVSRQGLGLLIATITHYSARDKIIMDFIGGYPGSFFSFALYGPRIGSKEGEREDELVSKSELESLKKEIAEWRKEQEKERTEYEKEHEKEREKMEFEIQKMKEKLEEQQHPKEPEERKSENNSIK
jgi:hypothetical protein